MSDEWEPGAPSLDRRRITVVAPGVESLLESLPVVTGRARRRQVLKTKGVRVMRLSFDAGQVLRERAENAAMLIQTLKGRVTLTVDGEQIDMPEGAVIHLQRQLAHSIAAVEASHLMVTLLGPRAARPRPERARPERAPSLTSMRVPDNLGSREWAQHNSVLAANGANSDALDKITHRHSAFLRESAARTAALLDALAGAGAAEGEVAALVAWMRDTVLPYLVLEAEILYPVASLRPQQRPLVAALEDELSRIVGAVDRLDAAIAGTQFDIASAAVAVRVSVGRHLGAEAEVLLPTLAVSTDESLAGLLAQLNERVRMALSV